MVSLFPGNHLETLRVRCTHCLSPHCSSPHQNLLLLHPLKRSALSNSPILIVTISNLWQCCLVLKCWLLLAPDFQLPLWTSRHPSIPANAPGVVCLVLDSSLCTPFPELSHLPQYCHLLSMMLTNSEFTSEAFLGFKLLTRYLHKDVSQAPQVQHAQLKRAQHITRSQPPAFLCVHTQHFLFYSWKCSWGQPHSLKYLLKPLLWHFLLAPLPSIG